MNCNSNLIEGVDSGQTQLIGCNHASVNFHAQLQLLGSAALVSNVLT